MKAFFGLVLALLLIVGPAVSLYADETTVSSEIQTYRKDMGKKAARGMKNIAFGWTEIPKKVVDVTNEAKNPFWGLFAGVFQGGMKAITRTVSGVSDVLTAPITPEKEPIIETDISQVE